MGEEEKCEGNEKEEDEEEEEEKEKEETMIRSREETHLTNADRKVGREKTLSTSANLRTTLGLR